MRNNYDFTDVDEDKFDNSSIADFIRVYGFEEIAFVDCSQLRQIHCHHVNLLHTVDVSKLGNLDHLTLDDVTLLQSIDVSKNTNLRFLECYDNYLTSLDVTHNVLLEGLSISVSGTSLDVSKNSKLKRLNCGGGNLTSLEVSKNTELVSIYCSGNNLSVDALNALFSSLLPKTASDNAAIYIGDNSGTDDCDRSIATGKGWTVGNSSIEEKY
jgi:hypothetical protein